MAELRYVQVPKSVAVSIGETKWSFPHCLLYVVDAHSSFNTTGTGIRAGARILALFEGKSEGDVVTLDQADWKLLNEAFEKPATGYIPQLQRKLEDGTNQAFLVPSRMFIPYIDAVSDEATKTAPAPKALNGVETKALPEAAQA